MGLLIELIFFKAGFWPGIALLTVETGENSMCPRGEGKRRETRERTSHGLARATRRHRTDKSSDRRRDAPGLNICWLTGLLTYHYSTEDLPWN